MDFVKREDPNLMDDENYKVYLDNLQKSHQMEVDYQHTPISMEQLHQAMQSSLNASTVIHNFQLPLSPRQMSTLMLKTNHLSRNLNFNEIPAHLSRNLTTDMDLVQNLAHELPQNLGRHDDIVLSQNLSRNLDITLARNLTNELESQNLVQTLVQNINEQEFTRSLANDLNQSLSRIIEGMPPNLRADLPHNLNNELDLSHHLNRQSIEQEILSQNERRTPLGGQMTENHLLGQNLGSRLELNLGPRIDQRLVSSGLSLHESQRPIEQNEQLLPIPFHIKSEQDDDGYFYENINHGNGLNGHISIHAEHQPSASIHQDNQMYLYNNHNISNIPALNPIDLYSRPQNYVQNYQNNRDNPQNLVMHRQFDNASPYQEDFKKFRPDGAHNSTKNDSKEQPKENLKPSDQNKIFYSEFDQGYQGNDKNDNESADKLTISEDLAMIKGEYACYKCNDVFPTKRGLKQHSKVCSKNGESDIEKLGKFSCSQCSYRCQSPAILKIHERTHTGERPFSCTFCDYKSGQKNNVAKHILVHMKEKPFRCQYCEYRCAQKNNLVVHERTHTGYKPFACPYCDYRTVQKPNLVKHMYLHTDQKPFSCDMCSYRCVQKTNLTKHKQRHLNEKDGEKVDVKNQKPYRPRQKSVKCSHCSYRCVQKSSLDKHMQFKHCNESYDANRDPIGEDNLEVIIPESLETIQNLSVKKDFVECQEKEQVQS